MSNFEEARVFFIGGSPVTFWFDVVQDFDNGMITPSQDWGNCQMDGNATWQVSPTSGASINVWSEDDADITFNSTGSWTVTATHPGWTCEDGDCGDSIGSSQASVGVNINCEYQRFSNSITATGSIGKTIQGNSSSPNNQTYTDFAEDFGDLQATYQNNNDVCEAFSERRLCRVRAKFEGYYGLTRSSAAVAYGIGPGVAVAGVARIGSNGEWLEYSKGATLDTQYDVLVGVGFKGVGVTLA